MSQGWQEVDTGDAKWQTGGCNTELEYNDLQKLGIFS
jgi:hypothetical protein